jgi:hypothetical protein
VRGPLLGPVLLALGLRLAAVLVCDRVVADVGRFAREARHLLDVSWNPYETKGLHPIRRRGRRSRPQPWLAR